MTQAIDTRELEKELLAAITRAEDGAGTLPAKEAVKLRPADWHRVVDLGRQAATTIADLRATVAEAGWRTMDSAPKDGTWIWLYVPGHGEVRARWGGAGWSSHGGRMVIRATHWMPRPAEPATAKHGGSNAAE